VFRKVWQWVSQSDDGKERQQEEAAEQFVSRDVGNSSEIHHSYVFGEDFLVTTKSKDEGNRYRDHGLHPTPWNESAGENSPCEQPPAKRSQYYGGFKF
jgi:hypothetical protein